MRRAISVLLLGVLVGVLANYAESLTIARAVRPTPPTARSQALRDTNGTFPIPTCTTRDVPMHLKNGIIAKRYRWTHFYVHPDKAYNNQELQAINDGMYNLMQVLPCVEFGIYPQNSNPTGDYIRIIKGTNNGCNSYVGRLGGRQDMNLQSPGCMDVGTVMHEMIHALGFDHEHNRSDRDDYLNIYLQNVISGYEFAFDKVNSNEYSAFGVAFNYRSIMHYYSTAFSKNGRATMLAKNGQEIGSTGELQETDKRKLKLMYNC